MCHPAADRLRGQAGGNHGLWTPSADYSPTGDSEPLETYGVWPSTFWPVGPALAQTVFDAGRRRAIPESTLANYHAAVATYCQTSPTKG
jgi:outer membrane protein TolC